ncbi:peptidoglycan DD-metalloendopeptidase family protein [Calditerrivibrio nitroreducens]|uniref:Peptidase M23 n=1 Tax=Calditerrivibrio nitroreducens (strain DSM 19672 / NBRC 101217 / Yu37-1) TaxID=768670 RepID=E4TJN1_CALNY|nr:peptidoglycan DD-metalloendopeptidase family protein [Calditerrivibrio nitroreducens]ADR18193.1 Peptidase M23 [Calditerrivibrio nitroreducens DSM 19672]
MIKKISLSAVFIIFFTITLFAEEITVKPGDTFAGIFTKMFDYNVVIRLYSDLKGKIPGFVLREGQKIIFGKNYVHIPLDITKEVKIFKKDEGYEINLVEHPVYTINTVVKGTIKGSLFETINNIGESDELAIKFADIYQWEVDFFKEVHPGDSFSIVVEKIFAKGIFIGYGKILAADFYNRGRVIRAIYYDNGKLAGYFTPDGKHLKKGFLRAPLKFGRVSSKFTSSRLHPVLGRYLPHFGVDYAAPTGTPIYATGSGVVMQKGFQGGAGNFVKIKHPNNIITTYMHMSKFKPGLKVGSRVSQGEVIGYVGATGYATGPHVDYRIQIGPKYVNPLSFVAPPIMLKKDDIVALNEKSKRIVALLNNTYYRTADNRLLE